MTDSELETLEWLGRGKSNEEIACALDLPVQTIQSRCTQIKGKLSLKNDNALVHYAVCWIQSLAD